MMVSMAVTRSMALTWRCVIDWKMRIAVREGCKPTFHSFDCSRKMTPHVEPHDSVDALSRSNPSRFRNGRPIMRLGMEFTLLLAAPLTLAACSIGPPSPPGALRTQNWLMSDAVEPAGAPAFSGAVFASVEYQASRDTPLLAGPWLGQPDQFNRFGPRFASGDVFRIPQAGLSAHGSLFEGGLGYRATLLTGDNQILRNESGFHDGLYVRPIDASVTLDAAPHARLRLGLFRQPIGDEAASPQQRHIWRSHVTQQMVQERYFGSDGAVNGDPNRDLGPVSGFRDIGVQVFDAFQSGAWEHTYALMLGMGTGVDPTLDQTGLEKYLYWSSERILGASGGRRDGVKLYAWGQFGERTLRAGPSQTEHTFDRERAGVGASLRQGPWSLGGEWIMADGMIYHGPDGGTIPGRLNNDGALSAGYNVLPRSKADGWYVDVGYRMVDPFEIKVRYDVLNRGTDDPDTEIRFQALSIGGSYQVTPSAQLLFGYQFRRYEAPRLAASSVTNTLLDGVDNRVGVRFTYQLGYAAGRDLDAK